MGTLLRAYNKVNERKKFIVIDKLKRLGITHADGSDLSKNHITNWFQCWQWNGLKGSRTKL